MAHFTVVYDGTSYSPAILSSSLNLTATDGAWKGQEPDDMVGLYLSLQGEPFEYDVPADPDEHLSMTPNIDTQWLELPISTFSGRNVDSLDGLSMVYDGPDSINQLTGDTWRNPPGLLGLYRDEAFRRSRIDVTHQGTGRFALRLAGTAEDSAEFDVACEVPLGVTLTSSTGQAGEDRLRAWFDTFLRWDDFSWQRTVYDRKDSLPQHSLQGVFAP